MCRRTPKSNRYDIIHQPHIFPSHYHLFATGANGTTGFFGLMKGSAAGLFRTTLFSNPGFPPAASSPSSSSSSTTTAFLFLCSVCVGASCRLIFASISLDTFPDFNACIGTASFEFLP